MAESDTVISLKLQASVFALVSAAFTTIYITQPVLPVIQATYQISAARSSATISAVILGVTLANLPFGTLADRWAIRPIILLGSLMVVGANIVCTITESFPTLVAARFVQGLFIPALTTCLAAFLARHLPPQRVNVVMGTYVSATVAGGLGGRLLGGLFHSLLHWRWAFVVAAALVALACLVAWTWLPRAKRALVRPSAKMGFLHLLAQGPLLKNYLVAFCAFFVFSSIYNYLPFYLSGPKFNTPTRTITLMYLAYLIGILVGPLAGQMSNRFGNGRTMAAATVLFGLSLGLTLYPALITVGIGLAGICAGFFTIHAAAAGWLNRHLVASRGRANSLYVLFYYAGGACGITLSGRAYEAYAWTGVIGLGLVMLLVPLGIGLRGAATEQ
ncbi:MAG: MFS transporter [Desulfobacterales bacterium]|jgi:YNFM family putative membrane transporter